MFAVRLIISIFSLLSFIPSVWAKPEIAQVSFHNVEISTLRQAKDRERNNFRFLRKAEY